MWFRSTPRSSKSRLARNSRVFRRPADIEPLELRQMRSATPFISASDVTITEGNDGTRNATITVSLSASPKKSVVVDFRTENGAATAGSDFKFVSGTLTFSKGQRSKTIVVPIYGDRLAETPDETFVVRLLNARGGTIADGAGNVTIIDDEPRISISNPYAYEGCGCYGTTSYTFYVQMAVAYDQTVTIGWATADGSATLADNDYTAASGTIIFAPGDTYATITVNVLGDVTPEYDEWFLVNLTITYPGTIVNAYGQATIVDDDTYLPPPPDDGGYVPPVECTPDYANYPYCN